MSNEKVLRFSREDEKPNYPNIASMMKFLDSWEKVGSDQEQTIRLAQTEKRRLAEFALKSDGEIFAIVNRGTPETWKADPMRYAAALFELRGRGYLVDATT